MLNTLKRVETPPKQSDQPLLRDSRPVVGTLLQLVAAHLLGLHSDLAPAPAKNPGQLRIAPKEREANIDIK